MNELVINKRQTPEDRELANKKVELEKLKVFLTERELDLATLKAELNAFDLRYLQIVGVLYAELDEIEAQIAEAEAEQTPDNKQAKERAAKARAQADETSYTTGSVKKRNLAEKFKPSESLKRLYRELARLLHPDLVLDEKEKAKRHDLMAKANKAYEAGDEELLVQMLAEQQSSPDAIEGDSVGAELIRVIRQIARAKKRLEEIDDEFASLERSDLFELRAKVEEADREGRDLLSELATLVNETIVEARHRFAAKDR